jgi:hypothetical protein
MVHVSEIKLCTEEHGRPPFFDDAEFTRLLAATHRWDKVTKISLNCSEDIAAAALNHCDLNVLKNVSLSVVYQDEYDPSREYLVLKSRYSAQPHSLETLSIYFEAGSKDLIISETIHDQVTGIGQVTTDFPGLKHLYIHGPVGTRWCSSPESDEHCYHDFVSDPYPVRLIRLANPFD